MKKNNSKKRYTAWWAITLMVIIGLIILGIIIANFTENVQFGVVNINSDNYKATESESISQLTAEDCPKSLSYCEGTTEINYSYQFIDGGCIEEIASNENNFDCGYIVPCDLDSCKLKDTNACDGTTKVITAHFCDIKLGCTNKITRDENNTYCGYLIGGKYTLEDVHKIKEIAKDCKLNLDDCIDESEYSAPRIKLGYEALYSYPEGYRKGDAVYLVGTILTPYVNTILLTANKEKTYSDYEDEFIISALESDKFAIMINTTGVHLFNNTYSIGGFKTIILKDGDEIYRPQEIKSFYNNAVSYGKTIIFSNYKSIKGKRLTIIIVGEKGEASNTIDFNDYK